MQWECLIKFNLKCNIRLYSRVAIIQDRVYNAINKGSAAERQQSLQTENDTKWSDEDTNTVTNTSTNTNADTNTESGTKLSD